MAYRGSLNTARRELFRFRLVAVRLVRRGRFQKLRELDRFKLAAGRSGDVAECVAKTVLRIGGHAVAYFEGRVVGTFDRLDHFEQRNLVGRFHKGVTAVHSARGPEDAVRHQVAKNLEQESLGHFAVSRQAAARDRSLGFQLSKLQCGPNGIRNGAGEFHE